MDEKLLLTLIRALSTDERDEKKIDSNDEKSGFAKFAEVGKSYHIRTVTHIILGRVTEISGDFVRLQNASWISTTGRWGEWLREGLKASYAEKSPEVEVYNDDVFLNTQTVGDFTLWNHDLPIESF